MIKIDIWSDIMCPFCYIGKRNFEKALTEFPHKEEVTIEWHSFQLDPSITAQPGKSVYEYLAERKGQSLEWSQRMHEHVTATAKAAGLDYRFDKAIIANSFDAHRLIQFAKTKGMGDEMEERLFKAYFTEGKDVGNHPILTELGAEIGLDKVEVSTVLSSNAYAEEVQNDAAIAHSLGINGVPFFVIDNKYGVMGAQPTEVFKQVLETAWKERAAKS